MITIQQIDKNRISLRCHYAYRQRCHDIPGAEFDYVHKVWVAPLGSLPFVQEEFKSEIYYKTPLWKLEGRPRPEKKRIEYLGPVPDLPELSLTPYSYQEDGIRFMIDRLNNVGFVLNGDGVGLGKTLMATGAVKWFFENRGARKILIICKKSLKRQWASEIRNISGWGEDEMPVFITGGSTKKRKLAVFEEMLNAPKGILISNYQDFLNWKEEIDKVNYDICIIDEAHCIKGREGKMNKLIADTCSGKRTILLTGTPIMSRPDDIWGIVHLATPNFFGPYKEFKKKYIVTEWGIYGEQIIGAKDLDELHDKMSEFLIMRTAEDVAIDLPKQRKAKHVSCEMDALQLKLQMEVEERKRKQDQHKQEMIDAHGLTEEVKAEILKINEMSKMYIATLQFIADDPALFRPDNNFMPPRLKKNINDHFGKMVPDSYKMSGKTEAAVDVVSELVDADEKVIVFCHFASAAKLLRHHFDKIPGANTVMYTGAESDETREKNIDVFRNDPECRVLIGTEAMAEGLNLQVARHIIHYEQADTYAQRDQRIGRIRRIGSPFDYIDVIDICSEVPRGEEGRSYDQIKIAKLRNDYRLTGAMLNKS